VNYIARPERAAKIPMDAISKVGDRLVYRPPAVELERSISRLPRRLQGVAADASSVPVRPVSPRAVTAGHKRRQLTLKFGATLPIAVLMRISNLAGIAPIEN